MLIHVVHVITRKTSISLFLVTYIKWEKPQPMQHVVISAFGPIRRCLFIDYIIISYISLSFLLLLHSLFSSKFHATVDNIRSGLRKCVHVLYVCECVRACVLFDLSRYIPTTVGSKSTKTALGTCFPAPVSLKKVLKESSPPPMVLSLGIWPSGWIPCSRQYNSQQALPIWTPA